MSIVINNWKMEDWEEFVKWARIGANNAMIGVNTEVFELPPHGRLIDADALLKQYKGDILTAKIDYAEGIRDVLSDIKNVPTIIPAEEVQE